MSVIGGVIANGVNVSSGGGSVDLSTTVILAPTASSRNVIQATTTGVVPLIAKLYTGSTANLQEWQNSAGTVLSKISSDGRFVFGSASNGATIDITGTDGTRFLNITDGYGTVSYQYGTLAATKFYSSGLSLFGSFNVGANADITVVRNAAGIMQIKDGSTGNGSLILGAYTASTVALTVKGAASQSANIQEWQKSDGTVLTKITKEGWINYSSDAVSSNASEYQFGVVCTAGGGGSAFKVYLGAGGGYIGCSGTPILVSNSVGLDRLTLGEYHTGYKGLSLDEAHKIWFCDVYGNSNRNLAITKSAAGILKLTDGSTGYGSLIVGAYTSSTVALTVKGAASQSGNLQEWQNSSATILTRIDSGGNLVMENNKLIQMKDTGGTALTILTIDAANNVQLRNPGTNGNSYYGNSSPANANTLYFQVSGTNILAANQTGIFLIAYNASAVPCTVKGYASQSANLQEWQNSSGTVLLNVDKDGKLKWSSSVYAYEGGGYLYLNSASGVSSNQAISAPYLITSPGHIYINDTVVGLGDTTSIGFTSDYYGSAAKDAGIARSAAGILKITDGSTGNGSLIVGAYSASTVALTVKAAASQTANIQEWQNSSGTVLSRVDKNGTLVTKVNAAPADADLAANECSMYFDSTNGSAFVRFKGKTADGTVVTGSLALT